MSDQNKNIDDVKKEAARRAKEEAQKRLAARQRNKIHNVEEKEKALSKSVEEDAAEAQASSDEKTKAVAEAKAKAAAAAKAAALAKQKEKKEESLEGGEKAKAIAEAKAKAAAAAKAAALAKQKEKKEESLEGDEKAKAIAEAKAKAAAAAKVKAAALAKQKEKEEESSEGDEKAKAIAAAKAKVAAAAKAKAAAAVKAKAAAIAKQMGIEEASEEDEKAKAIVAAKAKAAAVAKARAVGGKKEAEEQKVEEPSLNQPYLDAYVRAITAKFSEDVLEDFYINTLSKDVPTLIVKPNHYYEVMELLKKDPELVFNYMSELHATDFITHMEVYVHLFSYGKKQSVAVKVKLDRDEPKVPSIAPLWSGADWPEREAYDLLGVVFEGHPNLQRILMPDDWIGYPLRKDYEPFDAEV